MLMNRFFLKGLPARRMFGMALILILAIAVTSGFIHIQKDQFIAPPALTEKPDYPLFDVYQGQVKVM